MSVSSNEYFDASREVLFNLEDEVIKLVKPNNWLKMHGYPMRRAIPLRKRRTRSKKKNEK